MELPDEALELLGGEPKGRYRPVSLDEAIKERPPEFIVEGLIRPSDLVFIYGAPKSGKTFVVCDLLASVAREGGAFAGAYTAPRPLRSLYVAGEGKGMIAVRLFAACKRHRTDEISRISVLKDPPNLFDERSVYRFVEDISAWQEQNGRFDIIVFDTLARCMIGGDENTQKDAAVVIGSFDVIREELAVKGKGPALLVVHHATKHDNNMRGSSVFAGAADLILGIRRIGRERIIETVGGKDVPDSWSRKFQLAQLRTTCVVEWV